MKKQYEEYVMLNSVVRGLCSIGDHVEYFCDEFELKVKWSGLFKTNQTYSKTLKSLESKGLIRYAFKCKIDRGWGAKGGNVNYYTFTEQGYLYRNQLRANKDIK